MLAKMKLKLSELRFIYKLLGPLKRMFWVCVFLFLFYAAWEAVVLTAMATFLETIINPAGIGAAATNSPYLNFVFTIFDNVPKEQQPLVGFLMTTISLLLQSLINIGIMTYQTKFSMLFMWQTRNETFKKLTQCNMTFFDNQKKGNLIQMVINETRSCYAALKVFLNMTMSGLKTIVYLALMFLISWHFSTLVIIISLLFVLENYFVGKIIKRWGKITVDRNRDLTATADEGIGGIKQIKLLWHYSTILRDFSKSCWDADSASRKTGLMIAGQQTLSRLLGLLIVFMLLFINSRTHMLSIATLLMFFYLIANLMTSLTAMNQKYGVLNASLPAVENIRRFFNEAEQHREKSGERLKTHFLENKISFKNVTLDYGKGKVLEDITLDIPKGISIAFVGESGAGKTSLINLLPKLYKAGEGIITVDGIDIKEFNLEYLRSKIAVVNQDTILFNKTIRENILIARPDATESQLKEACKNAFADKFIDELPDKYDTVVGDRGVKLSGGQRQRVNIAQAFLKDAEVLIFDEATSALDTKSEKYIQKAIERLEENKTSIVIAHRLSTIKSVDLIVVLDKGKIVEQGSWAELLNRKGAFYDMIQRQTFAM